MQKLLAVFDFETTGLDPFRHWPLEVGVVVVDVESGELLFQYGSSIEVPEHAFKFASAEALRVNGYTLERAVEGEPTDSVLAVLESVRKMFPLAVFAAHNTHFDYRVLQTFYERHEAYARFSWGHRCVDLATLGFFMLGTGKSDEIFAKLDVAEDPEPRHSALGDARRTARALVKLYARVPRVVPHREGRS